MTSIRLSMLLYFLGLLALAVGTASVLAYQTAERTLEAKKKATEQLIEAQFRERSSQEAKRLDDSLLLQAQMLAKHVRIHMVDRNNHQRLYALGLLTSNLAPNGYLLFPGWFFQSAQIVPSPQVPRPGPVHPLYWEVYRKTVPEVILKEDPEHVLMEEQADYIQVNSVWTKPYHSPSLRADRLPLDPATFAPDQVLYSRFEEVQLPSGKVVRRVLLKTPLPRGFVLPFLDPRRRGQGGGGGSPQMPSRDRPPANPPGGPPNDGRFARPPLYIHCAYDIARYREKEQEFQQGRQEELLKLDLETRADLAHVRNRLVLIGPLTFLAALLGSFWLVRLGLSPLRRLCEAVSKVSPRDFRLPIDDRKLPAELKPIVQRLKETLELLKRAFAREKQATADISHELRTPLAVLLTTTELALRKQRTAEQYREMLQDCRLSAQQMNEIVLRLLTLARLDAGVDQLQSRPIDLAQLAEQCATMVRPLAEARGLTLEVHGQQELPMKGDADKLREVLNNLLHNAIQYNRQGGRIDLSLEQDEKQLCLEVKDTGIGISPEARTQIFERFYRADQSRSGDGLHAGLGLALVKEYVDLMGGRVDVESEEGRGSTFRVWLPA